MRKTHKPRTQPMAALSDAVCYLPRWRSGPLGNGDSAPVIKSVSLVPKTLPNGASRSPGGVAAWLPFNRSLWLEDARFDVAQKCANIVDTACAVIEQSAEQFLEIRAHRNGYRVKRVAVESRD